MDGNGERAGERAGERTGERTGERHGDSRERERESSDTSGTAAQSKRPPYARRATDGSDAHHRPKHQKRVVGGGAGRLHARVPSSKGLHKNQNQNQNHNHNQNQNHSQSTAKLRSRASSPVPAPDPERIPPFASPHRRTTSDLSLTAVALDLDPDPFPDPNSNSNAHHHHASGIAGLRKNTSQSNLISKRNRSHVEITKRSKSTANIKRSSSHKDVQKLKGSKNQVHFDLGDENDDDGNDDEWVDASASASPYLSRRGSVVSGGQSPAKPPSSTGDGSPPQASPIATSRSFDPRDTSPTRQRAQHNNYITSRLLQRTPSHGAPPQMSNETASVPPPSGSPPSQASRGPPSLYGTPKTSALGGSGQEELVSRFINGSGPSSGGHGETDSYFVPSHAPVRRNEAGFRRPQSLGNLNEASRDSASEEEDSALAPRSRTPRSRAVPASQSRIQQKLNLQRASSSIEPAQAGPGVGVVGASLLVGNTDYEHRDPRIGRLVERAGMEYLVVRRYQNPIARSIARLSHLPNANKNRRIPKQNGTNGTKHGKTSLDLDRAGRLGLSKSMTQIAQSRPTTPRRSTSIRTTGARSSYTADDERLHDRTSGSSYVDENDDGLAALLRNLWDKNTDLSASQD
ncbi:hypothetical protein F4859DRAFT_234461 [Xylaria cf. heliscus]|nr:hypothetical protein F4859DRAFT_234461 [Xylaria cf. heliscus]